jgi:MtN3 and saliva related transmembrane protein
MTDVLGWGSSIVLLATIAAQISKQWGERTSRGVSPWLYVGQAVASLGFCVYSALLGNWVFIVTNVLLALAAFVGLAITVLPKRALGQQEQRQ